MLLRSLVASLCLGVACICMPARPARTESAPVEVETAQALSGCRYRTVWIDYSRDAAGMSSGDASLNAQIARMMERELARAGHAVTRDPAAAYWSLMLMAANTGREDQFAFTAMLSLRNLKEAYGTGLRAYSRPGDDALPTMFTGLSYGRRSQLPARVREYVRAAEDALLPMTRRLCDYEAADQQREHDLELELLGPRYEG